MQGGQGRRRVQVVQQGADDRFREVLGRQLLISGCRSIGSAIARTQGLVEPVQAALRLLQQVVRPGQGRAVLAAEQGVAQGLAVIAPKQVADGLDVAQGFGHLLRPQGQHAVVQPVAHAMGFAAGASALGGFVFVMREGQVRAAAVNVDARSQMLADHGGALDVPAGAASAPRAVPARQLRARGLPEHEILGVLLVGRHLHPSAVQHVLQGAPGQAAVGRIGRHMKQHMAFGLVGEALGDQGLDHGQDLGDVLRGSRLLIRGQDAEGLHIFVVGLGMAFGERLDGLAFRQRLAVDLVIDIGDVADVDYFGVQRPEQAAEHIEHHRRPAVADVDRAIHGRPADIHGHPLRVGGPEKLLAPGQAVV